MSSIEKAAERLNKMSGRIDKTGQNQNRQQYDRESRESRAVSQDAENQLSNGPVHNLMIGELSRLGFLTPATERGKFSEEYRTLKRPLLKNAFGKGAVPVERGNLIMVVSALPGEGKTFTSLNLAMSMAMERDTSVLLVDADVVKPTLTKLLGLDNRPGLIDILLDTQLNLSDVIVRTNVPKLNLLPSGRMHQNSTELLASDEMERIASELAHRYADRVIVFDAPPLLATTEAPVLCQLAGQILMVVEAGKTPQHIITEAVSRIDDTKIVGMLLNKGRKFLNQEYGGDYGYYGQ